MTPIQPLPSLAGGRIRHRFDRIHWLCGTIDRLNRRTENFANEALRKFELCNVYTGMKLVTRSSAVSEKPRNIPSTSTVVISSFYSYSPESWYRFYCPRKVEGWVDISTAVRMCSHMSKNRPDIFSCNISEHFPIWIIFGTNISK